MNFKRLSVDEFWNLQEKLGQMLEAKLRTEKQQLEKRLASLARTHESKPKVGRRTYPDVLPKYRNPIDPQVTWSGSGKKPTWVVTAMQSGKTLNELAI